MNDIASEMAPDTFARFTEARAIGTDADRLQAEVPKELWAPQLPLPGEPADLEALPSLYGAELVWEGVVQ